jgi:NitT/TauT family transport system permease protein
MSGDPRRLSWTRPVAGTLLAILVLLAAWQLLAMALKMEEVPTAAEALRALPVILSNPGDVLSILASVRRMAIGYALGLLVAVPLGLAMGRSRVLADTVNPLTALVYPVPKAALMPIIMLWVGIGDVSKILVIFLGVSLPMLYHAYQGGQQVDEKLLWSASAMGMTPWQRLLRVVLPAAMPEVLLGCRVGLSMALITMVSSEMISRQNGAGDLLFNAMDMAVYTDVYAMIVLIGAFGLLLDFGFECLRRRLTHWSDTLDANVA